MNPEDGRCSIYKPPAHKHARRERCSRPAVWSVARYAGGPAELVACTQHLGDASTKVATKQTKFERAEGVAVLQLPGGER